MGYKHLAFLINQGVTTDVELVEMLLQLELVRREMAVNFTLSCKRLPFLLVFWRNRIKRFLTSPQTDQMRLHQMSKKFLQQNLSLVSEQTLIETKNLRMQKLLLKVWLENHRSIQWVKFLIGMHFKPFCHFWIKGKFPRNRSQIQKLRTRIFSKSQQVRCQLLSARTWELLAT